MLAKRWARPFFIARTLKDQTARFCRFSSNQFAASLALTSDNMNFLLTLLFSGLISLALGEVDALRSIGGYARGGAQKIQSKATLVSEVSAIAAGDSFDVALHLQHPPGWHSYYQNPDGIEQAAQVQWTLPEGFRADPPRWPTPQILDNSTADGKSFAYANELILLYTIHSPRDLKIGDRVTLSAAATWQICQDSCLNEKAQLQLTVEVANSSLTDSAQAELFARARQALPVAATNWKFQLSRDGEAFHLDFTPSPNTPAEFGDVSFISNERFINGDIPAKLERRDDHWRLTLTRKNKESIAGTEFGEAIAVGSSLSGILVTNQTWQNGAHVPAIAVPPTAISAASPRALPWLEFLPICALMLLGGLILNLMPCVFPVIGIKILGFVQQAGQDRKKIVAHGVMFAVGVIVSFWALSGILFAARSAVGNEALGWGYQLQNPWVVLALMMLMFILALNMFGLFEIGTSATGVGASLQQKNGISGTFFSGVLATVVATPCSAPFLGAAIGVAVTLPAVQFFLSFTAMALGLALPYLVLSLFPRLVDFLPRPGAWMETFKQAMSFLLFATTGFLLWIYAGLIGLDHLLQPIFGLCAVAIAAWIYGRWANITRSASQRRLASFIAILLAAAGIFYSGNIHQGVKWQKWSAEQVADLLKENKPVYVDFTAQWCATCQVNKARAYTPEVIALMEQSGVVALKADKTKPDPAIESALAELKRSAIPVNVLYIPGKPPIITPELLDAATLLDLFKTNLPAKK